MNHSDKNFVKTIFSAMAAMLIAAAPGMVLAGDPMIDAATEARIAPVGKVNTSDVAAAPAAAAGGADPKATYQSVCFACHGTGAAGAPKFGDKAAWKARIAQGMDTLFDHAINGFKGMPAKGGRGDLSDDTVKAVVKYMVSNSK